MTRPPRIVLLATAAFGLLTAFWSVLTPLTEAPDEPAHLGVVLYVADTGEYPAYDGLQHTAGLFQLCVDFATSTNWCRTDAERARDALTRERPADAAPPKHGRVHWDDPDFQRLKPGRMNQMPQHPPLYYLAMAGALRVERAVTPGELSVDTELAYLRLVNALVVLPLPWLAWLLARRLGAPPAVGAVAALLPLAVPQLTHIGGTLNNDNLFVVLVSALMALLAGVVRGDRSWRTAVLVGLATGLALLTKGFGVVLPPVVLLAYLIGTGAPAGSSASGDSAGSVPGRRRWSEWWRVASVESGDSAQLVPGRRRWSEWWRGAMLAAGALAVGLVVSGWWYLGNLAATGHVMPSIEDERLSPETRPAGFRPELGDYASSAVSRLVEGFWGAFGWRRVELPTVVSAVATLVCLAAVVLAFRRPSTPAERPVTRPQLAVLLAPIALLGAFVLVRSAVIYRDSGRLAFQQGRYLFAGLTAAAVVVAIGAVRRLGDRAVPAALATALVLQALAVAWCLDGWWGADGVPLGALRSVVAWSGWPDPVVVVLLVLAPVALGILARDVLRSSRAGPPTTAAGTGTDVPDTTRPVESAPSHATT